MANTNMGKITAALSAGKRAYDTLYFGPDIPSAVSSIENSIADWAEVDEVADKFVAGIHKWGQLDRKVTK